MNKWIDNPIFIGGHRKSGTTLIPCIFDNHEEVLSLPFDSGFFYGYYPVCKNEELSNDNKIELALKYLCKNDLIDQLNISNQYENRKKSLTLLEKLFREFFSKSKKTPKLALTIFVQCFNEVFYKDKETTKIWLEKTTSSEIYAKEIFEWFPNAKFIHIIRDPRDNFASLKSGWKNLYSLRANDSKELIQSMIDRGKLGMELAKLNSKRFGKERYMVLKYEDLVSDPKKYVKILCKFIGIKYADSLLRPTVLGHHWKGNNLDSKNFNGISSSSQNKWQTRIQESEAYLIEYYFKDLMKYFNYKTIFNINDQVDAAVEHYNWYNNNQSFKV